jgi:hypothetical protein
MGVPFVPDYYKSYHGATIPTDQGTNAIQTAPPAGDQLHLAFSSANAQGLHVDGTVEPLGLIKCAMLYCVHGATVGGASTIFNAVSAFATLCRVQPVLAVSLLDSSALMRKHSSPGSLCHYGPVFAVREREILNRFAVDNTSYWEEGFEAVPGLRDAYTCLTEMATQSRYGVTFTLREGDVLIIANDKISHGRTSYVDGVPTRKLYRGLFTVHPQLNDGRPE